MSATFLVLVCSLWFIGKAWLAANGALAKMREAEQAKLAQGRDSVPAFIRAGRLAVKDRQFDDALKQAKIAVDFDPKNAEAHLFKAQMLIVYQRFADAQTELEKFRELQPGDVTVEKLWKLCRQARPSDTTTCLAFADLFNERKDYGLADGMTRKIAANDLEARKKLFEMYRQRIEKAWPDLGKNLSLDAAGKFNLTFKYCGEQVKDLSPLQGMPLTTLHLGHCGQVRDLSPLKGMPLTGLDLYGCGQVQDLSPLKGMPLTSLNLENCGQVRDLSPLKGMPLTSLNLAGCGQVLDLSPLEGMKLSWIALPPQVDKGMDVLRRMKTLGGIGGKPAAEFWKEYDAGKYPQYKN